MWISRETYDDLRRDVAVLREAERIYTQQNHALEVTMNWLTVRVTQLEQERAQLLFNYTGVKVPTPRIEHDQHAAHVAHPASFADVGDAEAARLGISWDEAGNLVYASEK